MLDTIDLKPHVILTDMDPAMNAACQNIYTDTYHIHCIWHISQNLPKRLKHKLGTAEFKTFNTEFWKTRNSLCVKVFEQRFQALLERFPNSSNYILSNSSFMGSCFYKSYIYSRHAVNTTR